MPEYSAVSTSLHNINDAFNGRKPTDETTAILEAVGDIVLKRPIEDEKEALLTNFQRQLDKISSPSKLSVVKKFMAPLSPTLTACDANNKIFVSLNDQVENVIGNNAKIKPQRLWSTKKTKPIKNSKKSQKVL